MGGIAVNIIVEQYMTPLFIYDWRTTRSRDTAAR